MVLHSRDTISSGNTMITSSVICGNICHFPFPFPVFIAKFIPIYICRMLFVILEEIAPIGFLLTFIWIVSSIGHSFIPACSCLWI